MGILNLAAFTPEISCTVTRPRDEQLASIKRTPYDDPDSDLDSIPTTFSIPVDSWGGESRTPFDSTHIGVQKAMEARRGDSEETERTKACKAVITPIDVTQGA